MIRHLPESCRVKAAGKSRESPLVRSHNMVIYDSLSDKLSGVLVLAEC